MDFTATTTSNMVTTTPTTTTETTTEAATTNVTSLSNIFPAQTAMNTDLILGIGVGGGLIILLIVVVTVVCTYRKMRRATKGKEIQTRMPAPPVSSDVGVKRLEPNRRRDETSTDNPGESDPGSVDGSSANCRDTGLYMDMSKSMTFFKDQLVGAPSPHGRIGGYVNTGRDKRLHNPEIEQSDDYENRETWLEHERSKSLPGQSLEQLGQNPVYFNLLNLTKADEQSTPPPPKPHLKPGYVNVHS